jgi:hypothetical protein
MPRHRPYWEETMKPIALTLAAVLVGLCVPTLSSGQADPAPSGGDVAAPAVATKVAKPKVHQGNGWAIVAPDAWRVLARVRPPTVLYLVGDGRGGIPLFDGILSPLKVGLQVQVFPQGTLALKERVAGDVKALAQSGTFEQLQEPRLQDVTLADGTPATVLDVEFVARADGRASAQRRVYCADPAGRHVVASGFVACSRAGLGSVKAIKLPEFVRAHVESLVLDPAKVNPASLRPAYEGYNWNATRALARADEGNGLVERGRHAEATGAFRDAIKEWGHLPVAHNGLAWALLHADPARPEDLPEALREALLAVEQTEGLDFAALDTLSLAQDRGGDKEQATATIKKALKLRPNHPELLARLKSLE